LSKENILESEEVPAKLNIMADKVFSYGLPKAKATGNTTHLSSTKVRGKEKENGNR